MNKQRRKNIDAILLMIGPLQEALETVAEAVESIKDEEEEYKDGIPESFQSSERYAKAETAVGYLEEAKTTLDQVIADLETVVSNLGDAQD